MSFSCRIHTNTGCEFEDHSKWAVWAGQPWPLNLAIFTPRTQTDEFGHYRGDVDNPVCLPKGAACGDGAEAGPAMACCGGLACRAGEQQAGGRIGLSNGGAALPVCVSV